jgi:multidrug efflux pump
MKNNEIKMGFIETCIKKPILPIVISIFVFLFGFFLLTKLEIRNKPKIPASRFGIYTNTRNPTSPQEVEKITTKIEHLLPSVPGIEEFTSVSKQSTSDINVIFKAGIDEINAFNDLRSVISKVSLGENAHPPEVYSQSEQDAMLYLNFYPKINPNEKENSENDKIKALKFENLGIFLKDVFIPNIKKINGVGNVKIYGDKKVEFNIDLNLLKMSQLGILPHDVSRNITNNTKVLTFAPLKTNTRSFSLTTPNMIVSKKDLEHIVIDHKRGIYLKDIAKITIQERDSTNVSLLNGKTQTITIQVFKTSEGNPLFINQEVKKLLKEFVKEDVSYKIKNNYENSEIVFNNTKKTFIEAIVLLFIILIFFLGSIRILILPIIAIPLSILGTFLFMWQLKFTINEFTLMAFLLAIGLLVDDAILIIEKIERARHNNKGIITDDLITKATLDIYKPVIVMTATLFCVFLPVVFLPGEMGYKLKEFAVTISISVGWSCVFSLILTPMMCKYFMRNYHPFEFTEKILKKLEDWYKGLLTFLLQYRKTLLLFTSVLTVGSFFLFTLIKTEYEPKVNSPNFIMYTHGLDNYKMTYLKEENNKINKVMDELMEKYPDLEYFQIDISTGEIEIRGRINNQQKEKILPEIKEALKKEVPYINFITYGKDNKDLSFEIIFSGYDKFKIIDEAAHEFIDSLEESGLVKDHMYIKESSLSYRLEVNKEKCRMKGINPEDIIEILEFILQSTKLKGGVLDEDNNKYKIIVGSKEDLAANIETLSSYPWRMRHHHRDHQVVFIRDLVDIIPNMSDNSISKFNGLKCKHVRITCKHGITAGEISKAIRNLEKKKSNKNIYVNLTGEVKEFEKNSGDTLYIFLACLLSIFLILAVLFNSFLKSGLIMLTVPLAFTGAIVILYFYGTINIYSTIGAITLVALITKHGILFMNQEGDILEIAVERLRPVLMTTIAMILGNVPLLLYTQDAMIPLKQMAYVIVPGLTYGTIMVLLVFPVLLSYIKKEK